MSNASHRKPEAASLPSVPVAGIVAVAMILALAVAAILLGLASLSAPPARASTGYLSPAVSTAKGLHLKPSVQAYTQFLEESGSYGLGVNSSALPWF